MGNLDSKRDWGHAKDYVRAMYLMMQQELPDDFVIATGETRTVRDFVIKAFQYVGIKIEFSGINENEIGKIIAIDKNEFESVTSNKNSLLKIGDVIVKVSSEYFRPTEVDLLIGNPEKAKKILNWEPEYTFDQLVHEMVSSDIDLFK